MPRAHPHLQNSIVALHDIQISNENSYYNLQGAEV